MPEFTIQLNETCKSCRFVVQGGHRGEPSHFCVMLGPQIDDEGNETDALDKRPPECPIEAMANKEHKCRVCGCVETNCRGCIERTGKQCYWIEKDLCSACKGKG